MNRRRDGSSCASSRLNRQFRHRAHSSTTITACQSSRRSRSDSPRRRSSSPQAGDDVNSAMICSSAGLGTSTPLVYSSRARRVDSDARRSSRRPFGPIRDENQRRIRPRRLSCVRTTIEPPRLRPNRRQANRHAFPAVATLLSIEPVAPTQAGVTMKRPRGGRRRLTSPALQRRGAHGRDYRVGQDSRSADRYMS